MLLYTFVYNLKLYEKQKFAIMEPIDFSIKISIYLK